MLTEIHTALRQLIWDYGRISPDEVDISFEAPTRERIERLVRPTVSLFLFDLVENTEIRQSSFPATRLSDHAERRMPPRRVDLRYMVSALTSEIEDEHRLLWRVLATLLKYPQLPDELLPEEARGGEIAVTTKANQMDDGRRLLDVWSGLGATPHPAIYYVVTAPLDLDVVVRSPLVLTRTLRYRRGAGEAGEDTHDTVTDIGGVVRDKNGQPVAGASVLIEGSARESVVTNATGEFILPAVAVGALRLIVTPPGKRARTVAITVPAPSYDVTLE
ncbi:MAG TPA: Pvc16 family protein [Ktedonobacterales bacterium]|nr:Pvc16 family protein [Ktedonobacterales bacterium]